VTIRTARVLLAAPILALASCSAVSLSGAGNGAGNGAGSSATAAQAGAAPSGHLKKVHDPGHVTGTLHGHCSYRDNGQLPDPRCTPGSIDPAVTQANIGSTICRSGYTKTVRPPESETERFKFDVAYPAYGDPQSEKTELDHEVSLELGGSNDATNLWPESPSTPNPKDKVENALNDAVCSGRITLAAAQQAIASDWLTAEQKLGLSGSAAGGGSGGGGSTGSGNNGSGGTSAGGTGAAHCTATASYDAKYHDYNVKVHSNQPDQPVTARASNGASHSYKTDSSGTATVYVKARSGNTIKVTVGAAHCSTRA
jgi:hypothetical protein